ncbi:MAG: CPBP family intramembrane metalloprotease [Deltaproteobacteria bacterium]|nr:CPBP family intramembrane metalloprotease [Deltaproteobacteria bacterium]
MNHPSKRPHSKDKTDSTPQTATPLEPAAHGWRGAAAFAPLLTHRLVDRATLGTTLPLRLSPTVAMLLSGVVVWRLVAPLPGSHRYRGTSFAIACGILLGSLAALANLVGFFVGQSANANTLLLQSTAAIHLLVLVPLAEELAFRGLIYRQLRRTMTPTSAVVLSSTVFALMHGTLYQCGWALALGLLAALVYEQTHSLVAPVLVHGLFNAVPVAIAAFRTNPHELWPLWLVVFALATTFAIAASRLRLVTEQLALQRG